MLTRRIYKERQAWRALPIVAALVLFASLLLVSGIALAVHNTGLFELDGNAVSANAAAPVGPADDWDRVCHEKTGSALCGTTSNTTGATEIAWSADCPAGQTGVSCGNINATIFTGGGSKDPIDINQWAWKDGAGGLPDKDNLLHGFAARYQGTGTNSAGTCPNGTDLNGGTFDPNVKCDVIFFGSDRFDNSGDAQQGFWFFQNPVKLGTNSVGGGTGFTGVHKDGDVLVISDFSNGGTTSTITVYKWDKTCTKGVTKPNPGDCGDINLRLLSTSDNAKCAATLQGNDNSCGIVNPSDGTVAPWPYTDKSGNTTYLQGELYEGGINLSTLGLSTECFSSIASETRSSTSTTATLKDFVLGGFGECGAALVTTPSGNTVLPGVTGSVNVSDSAKISVHGSNPPAPTGLVSFYLCGPSTTALTSCDATGTSKGSVNLNTATKSGNDYTVGSGNVSISASGYYCWFATWPGDTNYKPESPATAFSDGSSTECFSVRQPTSVTTTLHETDSTGADITGGAQGTSITINAGSYVVDYASLTPSSATGSVAFRYYGGATALADCTADTTGAAGTSAGSGTVSAGSAHGSPVQPGPGTYRFRAFYTATAGTLFNSSISDCSETLTVNQFNPSLTTSQTVTVTDSATITAGGGGALAGTAHFRPYSDSSCSVGNELAAQTNISVAGASPQTVSTTTIVTFTGAGPHTVYWKVSYDSTNPAQTSIPATCTENTVATITN